MRINPVTITISEHYVRMSITAMEQRIIALRDRKGEKAANEREHLGYAIGELTHELNAAIQRRQNNA